MEARWKRFMTDESGATMVEYGLIVALIAVIAAVGVGQFGISVNENLFLMAATLAESLR
jgi:pilus assembly protein Flp/PilA